MKIFSNKENNMKNIVNFIKVGVLAVIVTMGVGYVQAQTWTAPAGAPPGNNVAAPVNVGSLTQIKTGILGVGGLGSNGTGYFSIGSYSPTSGFGSGVAQLMLGINGNVGAKKYCDENGLNCRAITDLATTTPGGGGPLLPSGGTPFAYQNSVGDSIGQGDDYSVVRTFTCLSGCYVIATANSYVETKGDTGGGAKIYLQYALQGATTWTTKATHAGAHHGQNMDTEMFPNVSWAGYLPGGTHRIRLWVDIGGDWDLDSANLSIFGIPSSS